MKVSYITPSAVMLATMISSGVFGHTFLNNLIIDGKDTGTGKCIRPVTGMQTMFVLNPSSVDIRCRPGNQSPNATDICPVKAGSKIGVEWHHDTGGPTDRVISESHRGPCLVYMARMDQPIAGAVWFKIYEEGYNSKTKQWCTDKIRASHGVLNITIPANIQSGNYLLRTEIIALHEAQKKGYAQFYPNCAQVNVVGGGSAKPQGYKIPGIYKADDPGIFVNYRKDPTSYVIPGPPVYMPGNVKVERFYTSSAGN